MCLVLSCCLEADLATLIEILNMVTMRGLHISIWHYSENTKLCFYGNIQLSNIVLVRMIYKYPIQEG